MKIIPILFFSVFLITGCPVDDDNTQASNCPSVSDNITWYSYGDFELENAGRDPSARRIVSECGWHVYNGHNGGYGDTLQVASPGEEVIFVWAYNTFYGFMLNEGWKGSTGKGAMMGDHISDFYGIHPEFSYRSQNHAKYTNNDTSVSVYFDDNDFLEKIYVGYYFRY